jgi:hypothetical protein
VLGTDGKVHVAYELFIVNQSSTPTTLTSVEVLDPAKRDTLIDTIDGCRSTCRCWTSAPEPRRS